MHASPSNPPPLPKKEGPKQNTKIKDKQTYIPFDSEFAGKTAIISNYTDTIFLHRERGD